MATTDYKAVLFDLDGTLLDTLQDLADSTNTVLERHGYPVHPSQAYRRFVGDGVIMLVQRALPGAQHDEQLVMALAKEMQEQYARNWNNNSPPYDGIPEMLDELSDRDLRLAVLSNKPHHFTKLMVDALLPRWHFDAVVGARPEVPKKPDPTAALQLAAELGLKPAQFLYLGDTNTDMTTARAAGMFAVGALWGFRDAEELTQTGAHALIAHPRELVELLG